MWFIYENTRIYSVISEKQVCEYLLLVGTSIVN